MRVLYDQTKTILQITSKVTMQKNHS